MIKMKIVNLTMNKLRLLACASLAWTLLFSHWSAQKVSAQAPDPGVPGSFAVTRAEYDFGATAFTPTGFPGPVELTASVHYPTNLPGGPFPLVIFLHGRHVTCFSGTEVTLDWPCPAGSSSIPSYRGYDYAAELLASHGMIVVSVSANGVNARDNEVQSDFGARARAELIQRHLEILRGFNTTGGAPFGGLFVGKMDLTRVGTMGHSRGGEGVVRHFLLNQAQGSPFGVKAVFPLAPVNFSRFVINRVPLAVMAGYCDGDVIELQGVQYYDDARYNVAGDTAPKHTIIDLGSNHNFYNTVWTPGLFPAGTTDDWSDSLPLGSADPHCGVFAQNRRLTDAQQRAVAKAYFAAFFRAYLKGESGFLPILTAAAPPPPSATTTNIFPSYQAPDSPAKRRDVNRLLTAANLTTNTLGGAVSGSGLIRYEMCGGQEPQPRFCIAASQPIADGFGSVPQEPHTSPAALNPAKRGLSQLRLNWYNPGQNPPSSYQNDLPVGARDVSGFEALQFRASVNFDEPGLAHNQPDQPQDLTVVLTDGFGRSTAVRVSDHSPALYYPPGRSGGVLPKILHNTVRIPLSAFSGVNLRDVRSVRFNFNREHAGALLISDLAFASNP